MHKQASKQDSNLNGDSDQYPLAPSCHHGQKLKSPTRSLFRLLHCRVFNSSRLRSRFLRGAVATVYLLTFYILPACGGGSSGGGSSSSSTTTQSSKTSVEVSSHSTGAQQTDAYLGSFANLKDAAGNTYSVVYWGTKSADGKAVAVSQSLAWTDDPKKGLRTYYDSNHFPRLTVSEQDGSFVRTVWTATTATFKFYDATGKYLGGSVLTKNGDSFTVAKLNDATAKTSGDLPKATPISVPKTSTGPKPGLASTGADFLKALQASIDAPGLPRDIAQAVILGKQATIMARDAGPNALSSTGTAVIGIAILTVIGLGASTIGVAVAAGVGIGITLFLLAQDRAFQKTQDVLDEGNVPDPGQSSGSLGGSDISETDTLEPAQPSLMRVIKDLVVKNIAACMGVRGRTAKGGVSSPSLDDTACSDWSADTLAGSWSGTLPTNNCGHPTGGPWRGVFYVNNGNTSGEISIDYFSPIPLDCGSQNGSSFTCEGSGGACRSIIFSGTVTGSNISGTLAEGGGCTCWYYGPSRLFTFIGSRL
jgi:hypothetical protein